MTDGLHPDYEPLLRDLVARHGGIGAFSPVQREIAGQVAQLMLDMRSSPPGELVKHAEVMNKLMASLPPIVVPPAELPVCPHVITDDMTLHEAVAVYERMLHDVTPYQYPDLTGIDMATALTMVRKGDVLIRLKRLKAGDTADLDEVVDETIREIAYLRSELRVDGVPGPQIDLKAVPPEPRPREAPHNPSLRRKPSQRLAPKLALPSSRNRAISRCRRRCRCLSATRACRFAVATGISFSVQGASHDLRSYGVWKAKRRPTCDGAPPKIHSGALRCCPVLCIAMRCPVHSIPLRRFHTSSITPASMGCS
jgi:hypothetical protein